MRHFHLAAWHHLKRRILPYQSSIDTLPIVLEATTDADQNRHRAIFQQQLLNEQEWTLSHNGNITLNGLGIIDTPALLTALLNHPNITIHTRSLTALPPTPTILATAWENDLLPPEWHEQLRPLRGHATLFNATIDEPPAAHCAHYSIFPFPNRKTHYIGSIYHPNCADRTLRPEDNETLLAIIHQRYPHHLIQYHHAFIGIRASTRDYLPLIGALPDPPHLHTQYAKWSKNANHPISISPTYPMPHYIHAGLGSKGTLTAFLGADLLTAIISGTPLPIEKKMLAHLLPNRTIIKNIIRGKTNTAQKIVTV